MYRSNGCLTGRTSPTNFHNGIEILGLNQSNPPPPPPLHARAGQNADQADAMATKAEKNYQQKEKEKEQYKAVLAQKES